MGLDKTMSEIKWMCPNCDAENVDYPDLTVIPLCFDCGCEFDWVELGVDRLKEIERDEKK